MWTAAGAKNYAGKPRPVVIVQDDAFDTAGSVTVCPLTTDITEAPLFRVEIEPLESNGLNQSSRLMVDKLSTIAIAKLGKRLGRLSDSEMDRLGRAMIVFLGLAGSVRG